MCDDGNIDIVINDVLGDLVVAAAVSGGVDINPVGGLVESC